MARACLIPCPRQPAVQRKATAPVARLTASVPQAVGRRASQAPHDHRRRPRTLTPRPRPLPRRYACILRLVAHAPRRHSRRDGRHRCAVRHRGDGRRARAEDCVGGDLQLWACLECGEPGAGDQRALRVRRWSLFCPPCRRVCVQGACDSPIRQVCAEERTTDRCSACHAASTTRSISRKRGQASPRARPTRQSSSRSS